LRTPELVRALGGTRQPIVMLDSSVSIPVLAGLLYHPSDRHYSLAARHAFDQLRAHGFEIHLPFDYLEETASHLIDAYRDYGEVAGLDPDLRGSTNAFVSHYASLLWEGKLSGPDFVQYLRGFGFDEGLIQGDYYRARDTFMRRLQEHYDRYGIKVLRLGNPSYDAERKAEEAIQIVQYDKNYRRQPILLRHDRRTIAFLMDQDRRSSVVYMLCTWDGLHFYIREREAPFEPGWHVFDPAFLGDMLALAAPDPSEFNLLSPAVVAMEMTDEAAAKGAFIWDSIVSMEKGKLHNAELIAQAKEFKAGFLKRMAPDTSFENVRAAWMMWKQERQAELFPPSSLGTAQ
jgi:hypothetical protein